MEVESHGVVLMYDTLATDTKYGITCVVHIVHEIMYSLKKEVTRSQHPASYLVFSWLYRFYV
jgi:hypothetical protein